MPLRSPMLLRALALMAALAFLAPAPALLSRQAAASPVETEIVGGKKVHQGGDPFMVAIQFDTGAGISQCSGTLLDASHVLTAAHCVTDGSKLFTSHTVFYGSVRFTSTRSVGASVVTPHPGFDTMRLRYDVAVLKLDAPVTGPGIGFVKLPAAGNNNASKTGATAIVSGWGALSESGGPVNDLRETSLKIFSFNTCKRTWGMAGLTLTSAHLCAWANNKDTCFGDSGGPLFARTANGVVQLGVTSFGYGCATRIPGVYTRLSNPSVGNFVRRMMQQ